MVFALIFKHFKIGFFRPVSAPCDVSDAGFNICVAVWIFFCIFVAVF